MPDLSKLSCTADKSQHDYSQGGTRPLSSAATPGATVRGSKLNIKDEAGGGTSSSRPALDIDENVFGVFKAPLRERLRGPHSSGQ